MNEPFYMPIKMRKRIYGKYWYEHNAYLPSLDENIQGEGGIGDRGYRGEGDIDYIGRYIDLPKIGYDDAYQRNRRGIYAELRNLRSDMQEHFKSHTNKKRVYNKYIPI